MNDVQTAALVPSGVPPPTAAAAMPQKPTEGAITSTATTQPRMRRRSTSSRSSRSTSSRDRNRSPSPYRRRLRGRRSRSNSRSRRSRSRSRSGRYRHRRSSRTPSYRPPPLRRRPPPRRPRRASPYRPYRGRGGGGAAASSFLRRSPARPSPRRASPLPQQPATTTTSITASTMVAKPTARSAVGAAPLPLTERFENLLESTLRRNRRDYGVLGGLAHLVITNRLKVPLPTLMREAKELSVVIERNFPPELSDPAAKISYNFDSRVELTIAHPRHAGLKPVFERDEIPLFNKPGVDEEITKRMGAILSAGAEERLTKPMVSVDQNISGHADFRHKKGATFAPIGPSNPLDVPKGASYFLHDDRDAPRPYNGDRRRFGGYSRDYEGGRRRRSGNDYRDSGGYDSRRRHRDDDDAAYKSRRRQDVQTTGDRWCHDKFLELQNDEGGSGEKGGAGRGDGLEKRNGNRSGHGVATKSNSSTASSSASEAC